MLSEPDPFEVGRARHAPGLLRAFNDVGVLTAADLPTGYSFDNDAQPISCVSRANSSASSKFAVRW